jgi:uncharacterized protein (TIGR02145 family)
MPIRIPVVVVALTVVLGSAGAACVTQRSTQEQKASGTLSSSKRMPDGKQWTMENLNVNTEGSYCYEDAEQHCRRYGRLHTWESAQRACRSLGSEWRLPSEDDWRQLAKHYGGVREDSDDTGHAAYTALSMGGDSGFNALLGGGRGADGQYARLEAHGLYWTATETAPDRAWFYNFGKGGQALNRWQPRDHRHKESTH